MTRDERLSSNWQFVSTITNQACDYEASKHAKHEMFYALLDFVTYLVPHLYNRKMCLPAENDVATRRWHPKQHKAAIFPLKVRACVSLKAEKVRRQRDSCLRRLVCFEKNDWTEGS